MFRRWAEDRMYRRTMQLAVSELRRAARTSNALEKLQALDIAEQKLLETRGHYGDQFRRMPTSLFIEDRAVENSFRYLGKGVKLGDKDRIVCWYRLREAATYRVVYGDLSIKEMLADALPLPVEP